MGWSIDMSDIVYRLRESGSRSEVELHEDRDEAADRIEELQAQRDELLEALDALMDINDNGGPFGGEMYHDRVDRAWDSARAAIAKAKGST
jgi:hypothetical protein